MANKFKVGDNVRVIGTEATRNECGAHCYPIGTELQITGTYREGVYNFKKEWVVHEDDLELVDVNSSLIPIELIEEGYKAARAERLKELISKLVELKLGKKEYRFSHDTIRAVINHADVCGEWKDRLSEYLPKPPVEKKYIYGTKIKCDDNLLTLTQIGVGEYILIGDSFNRQNDTRVTRARGLTLEDISTLAEGKPFEIIEEKLTRS